MKRNLVIKGLVLSLMLILLVTIGGCGSTTTETTKAKEPANNLEKIKADGKILLAMGGVYPPFNFVNDKNEIIGFDAEIGAELAKRLGVKAEIVPIQWDGMIPGLLGKKFDMIMSSMAITPERLEKIYFSESYYSSGAQIFVPAASTIKAAADLKDKKVGVGLGTTFEKKARELGADAKTYKATIDAFEDMKLGRVEAVIGDKIVSVYANNKNNYGFKLVGDPLYMDRMGIGIRKTDPELLAAINKALNEMKADGTYEKISMKWFNMDIR